MCYTHKEFKANTKSLINLGGRGDFTLLSCRFSLSNSETTKAMALEFCSIQWYFIRDILTKFGNPNLPQSLDIGQNPNGGISNLRISGQSLTKGDCLNSTTSDAIVMRLRPVTKIEKRNKNPSKKSDNEVMLENYGVIVIFLIYD